MRWLRLSGSGAQNRPVSRPEIDYELPVFRYGGERGGEEVNRRPFKGDPFDQRYFEAKPRYLVALDRRQQLFRRLGPQFIVVLDEIFGDGDAPFVGLLLTSPAPPAPQT